MPDDVLAAAERICRDVCQADLTLSPSDVLVEGPGYRHAIRRAWVEAERPEIPRSIIIKQAVGAKPGHVLREWSALEFLAGLRIQPRCVPGFIGGDRDRNLLVLEDLGDLEQGKLASLLVGLDPAAAEEALLAASDRIGRINAAAMGRLGEYERLRANLPAPPALDFHQRGAIEPALAGLPDAIAAAGVDVPATAHDDARQMCELLFGDDAFRTLVHGDVCPSNIARVGADLWLLDFEVAGPGCALLDGAFTRLRHLNCVDGWRLPDGLKRRMETAYRDALAERCPAARDDAAFRPAMAAACAAWTAVTLRRLDKVREQDRPRGEVSWRQRIVSSLDALADALEDAARFPALHEATTDLGGHLRRAWNDQADLDAPLPRALRSAAAAG
jgi:hypothetical protein